MAEKATGWGRASQSQAFVSQYRQPTESVRSVGSAANIYKPELTTPFYFWIFSKNQKAGNPSAMPFTAEAPLPPQGGRYALLRLEVSLQMHGFILCKMSYASTWSHLYTNYTQPGAPWHAATRLIREREGSWVPGTPCDSSTTHRELCSQPLVQQLIPYSTPAETSLAEFSCAVNAKRHMNERCDNKCLGMGRRTWLFLQSLRQEIFKAGWKFYKRRKNISSRKKTKGGEKNMSLGKNRKWPSTFETQAPSCMNLKLRPW